MDQISIYRVQLAKVSTFDVLSKVIISPEAAWNVCQAFLQTFTNGFLTDREYCGVIFLNTKNVVTGAELISIGSLNAVIVTCRETFKGAILHNAASLIMFHSHPSGHPRPSDEDVAISKRMMDAGELLGIEFLDHIILGEGKFISLKQEGLI